MEILKFLGIFIVLVVVAAIIVGIYDLCKKSAEKKREQQRLFGAGTPTKDYKPEFIAQKLISIDFRHRMLRPELFPDCRAFSFDEIDKVQLIKDNTIIAETKSHGSLLNTFIGGAVAGDVGALAGACSGRQVTTYREQVNGWTIVLLTRVTHAKRLEISFPVGRRYTVIKDGASEVLSGEKLAQAIVYELEELEAVLDEMKPKPQSSDPVAEIRRFKQLFDEGIITEEEFTEVKRRLISSLKR